LHLVVQLLQRSELQIIALLHILLDDFALDSYGALVIVSGRALAIRLPLPLLEFFFLLRV